MVAVSRENARPSRAPTAAADHLAGEQPERAEDVDAAGRGQADRRRVQRDGHAVVDQAFAFGDHRQPRRRVHVAEHAHHRDRVGGGDDAAE